MSNWTPTDASYLTGCQRRYPEKCPKCGRKLKVVMSSNTTAVYEVCVYCGGRV